MRVSQCLQAVAAQALFVDPGQAVQCARNMLFRDLQKHNLPGRRICRACHSVGSGGTEDPSSQGRRWSTMASAGASGCTAGAVLSPKCFGTVSLR